MIDFPIDIVVPYVTGADLEWRQRFIDFCNKHDPKRAQTAMNERYRDWGFFKYFFRGIGESLPFVNNVFLIVESESQIPKWIDRDKVNIVLHKQFIPHKFLPTYNSTTIEMFLDKIPKLSEHFIYMNDDMYILKKMEAIDFFSEDGVPKVGFRFRESDGSQFSQVCNKCYSDVADALGVKHDPRTFFVPYHEVTPMTKSGIRAVQKLLANKISKNITPFRKPFNYNQYIYPLYNLLTRNVLNSDRKYAYIGMEENLEETAKVITDQEKSILVLNDSEKTNVDLWVGKNYIIESAFKQIYPFACKYEIEPKVTICICVYNAEELIGRCLDSIPKRRDIELLILDDASEDKTNDIIKEKIKDFPKFSVMRNNKNMGVGFCRNVLKDMANGKYIFFLDADDFLYTEKFEHVLDDVLKDQNVLSLQYTRNDGFTEHPAIFRGVFLKRKFIYDVRFNDAVRCYEDVDFKKRLIQHYNGKIVVDYYDCVVYHYNKPRVGSVTWDYRKSKGDPAYLGNVERWEKYKKGRRA